MSFTSTDSDHNESPVDDSGSDSKSRWESNHLKKGPWSSAEDDILIDYVNKHGEGNWNAVQKHTGLFRCGKSCRLRWANHLRPNLKKGAFSQEEEQLIIELHAKMGNRWARMAAHLPGRTDNEIKNYWNTRIKRRQRAGLPLYPPEMHVEVLDWSQEYANSEIMGEDRRHQEFLQLGSFETNVFFDCLNFGTHAVPGASDLGDMTACKILGSGASSPGYENFVPPIMPTVKLSSKRLWESELLYPGCSSTIKEEFQSPEQFLNTSPIKICKTSNFSVPCEVEHSLSLYGSQHSPVMIPDSHTLTDGIVPTSKPSLEAVKLELPSFQYSEATYDQWEKSSSPHSELLDPLGTYIQSPAPPTRGVESECFLRYNTGLLDMLLLEAKIRNNSTKNTLYTTCASTTPSADVAESGLSQIKSEEFVHSFTSMVYSDISNSKHNADEYQQRQREKERKTVLDITRPDVLLASSWLDHGLGIAKETGTMSDALAVLLGDDIGSDYMHMSVGQSAGVGSCSWSNMPPVCQMMELP